MQIFRTTAVVVCSLLSTAIMTAQNSVVQSLTVTNGPYRARLEATGLSSDVLLALPTSGGTLMTSGSAWVLGGQTLLPGAGSLGSTDAANVQVLTNGVARIHVNGLAGADQGWVGIGTTTPSAPLHAAGTLNPVSAGFHSGFRVATTLDATSAPPAGAVLGGTVSILEIPAAGVGGNLSSTDIIFGAGGAVFSSNADASNQPGNVVGVVGNITLTPSAAGMAPMPLVSSLFGSMDIGDNSNITNAVGVFVSASMQNNAIVQEMVGVRVQGPNVGTGSTIATNTGLYIANQDGITGVTTSRALHYDGPGTSDVVIAANGRVGIGTDAPTASMDIDGGLVVRAPAVIDIEAAASTSIVVGNRSFIVISNPNLGAGDAYPNNQVLTLSDGVDGQVLLIRGGGAQGIRFVRTDANINLAAAGRNLGPNDILTLIWYGSTWHEVSFANNDN